MTISKAQLLFFFEYGSTAFESRDTVVEVTWRMEHARLNKQRF